MEDNDVDRLAVLGEMAENLPAPVSTGLLKAIGGLLGGLTLLPTAWLRRPAQAIDDTTAGRSAVAAILAKGVAENALQDPVVMQAAAEIYMPNIIRKARNKVQVAQLAIEHMSENDTDGADAVAPDDDWMNTDLPPTGPSFITRVCSLDFGIRLGHLSQARRARSPQIAQASGALAAASGWPGTSVA